MTELRFVAACLEGGGRSFPTAEHAACSAADILETADRRFRKLLNSLPPESALPLEDAALQLASAWSEESFERGFAAGMKLMRQALDRNVLSVDRQRCE